MSNTPQKTRHLENSYQAILSPEFYERTPKAVFAALAVSLALIATETDFDGVQAVLAREQETLANNGVLKQRPLKKFLPEKTSEL